jgi:hypothetical protein
LPKQNEQQFFGKLKINPTITRTVNKNVRIIHKFRIETLIIAAVGVSTKGKEP